MPWIVRGAWQSPAVVVTGGSSDRPTCHMRATPQVVMDAGPTLWDRKDADATLGLTRLLEAGFLRLAEAEPGLCAARLPRAFHALTPQVGLTL